MITQHCFIRTCRTSFWELLVPGWCPNPESSLFGDWSIPSSVPKTRSEAPPLDPEPFYRIWREAFRGGYWLSAFQGSNDENVLQTSWSWPGFWHHHWLQTGSTMTHCRIPGIFYKFSPGIAPRRDNKCPPSSQAWEKFIKHSLGFYGEGAVIRLWHMYFVIAGPSSRVAGWVTVWRSSNQPNYIFDNKYGKWFT